MKTALLFAMPVELHSLPGAKDLEPIETISGVPVYEVAPGLLAACGGIGKVNAAMAAEILCLRYGVECILMAGVAASAAELPIGQLVVASEFVQHDMDTSAVGDPVGFVSTVNCLEFPTWEPEHCAELLRAEGLNVVTGRVASGDWFATRCDRSYRLVELFHPTLVEMEGCAIAQVCRRNGVRFVAVKSVSDRLFSDKQVDEYFDFGQALENLGAVVLPLAEKLMKEEI